MDLPHLWNSAVISHHAKNKLASMLKVIDTADSLTLHNYQHTANVL